MSYLSLYRKYRPGTFSDVLGQDHVTETLSGALREDRVSHAYVFSGPRGTGKTSTARILARALNCEQGPTPEPCGRCRPCIEIADGTSLDVYEMDAASHTSVDDVREIRERIPFASAGGARKVYIIDEAHQLSAAAFNALLKMLEEPPPHVVFVLCTTESHKLPATVVSRCQRFEFRRHTEQTISEHLARVAEAESIDADPDALALIARHAHGSMRDPLALLEQASGSADGRVSRASVVEILGDAPAEVLFALSDAIASTEVTEVFRQVETMVSRGWDPRGVLRQLLEHFRSLFLVANGATELAEVPPEDEARYREHAEAFTRAHLDWVMRVLGEAQADVRASTHPRLSLEVTLARAACLQSDEPGALSARIERLERMLVNGAAAMPAASTPAVPPDV
ncbi:MAG TPA: DNA polymerase III subunit gamma/tau, partial [Actinomycetota bacterium]|nr:DNA polymerase III subunit gamma/tau [Actinomycetota bacterium]